MRKTFAVLVMGCALFATAWVLDANPVKDERNVGRTTTHLDGLSGDHLLETLSSESGRLYGPAASFASYYSGLYLNEEAVAYSFNLSEGSRQAFEEVGGFKAFQRMMRSSRMALDLGTLVARIDGTNEATVFAVIYQDPAWTMFRLVREDGLWKIVARPGSHDKTVIYPSVLDGEVSK